MSATSSPYKEFGMTGHDIRRNRIAKAPVVWFDSRKTLDANRYKHLFDESVNMKVRKGNEVCRYCGQPRFAVDGLACRGSR